MDPFLKPSGGERLLANVGHAGARDVRVPDGTEQVGPPAWVEAAPSVA